MVGKGTFVAVNFCFVSSQNEELLMYHFKMFTSGLVIERDVRSGEGKQHSIPNFIQSPDTST